MMGWLATPLTEAECAVLCKEEAQWAKDYIQFCLGFLAMVSR